MPFDALPTPLQTATSPGGTRRANWFTTNAVHRAYHPGASAGTPQETDFMPSGRLTPSPPPECAPSSPAWSPGAREVGTTWPTAAAERVDAKSRLSRLAKTLELEVIPRLVGAHEPSARVTAPLQAHEIESFVGLLRNASDTELSAAVVAVQRRGLSVEAIFLDLFGPAASHLGDLWVADRCDFSTVTICLGRLQRLLREWSPTFGTEVEHPANGRRILLAQHPEEQHSFGLSMVAEFFRREGWEVLGGVGGAVADPSAQVSREWFDAVGFSIGSETRIDWLRDRIAKVRSATRNRSVVVLVGGPLFVMQPQWAQSVGADASGHEGGKAPKMAEDLLVARLTQR
jgi:MerR family transcriptional regulator, light-induced transcriptional regulator